MTLSFSTACPSDSDVLDANSWLDSDEAFLFGEGLEAVRRGWAITPLRGKKPILKAWQKQPIATEEEVEDWWLLGHNLGICTGRRSGLLVIDEDCSKGGCVSQLNLPPTVTAETGGGGRHYYFSYPPGSVHLGNSTGKLAPHVDTRGEGGMIVAVGSRHPDTGRLYEWCPGHSPDDMPLAALPEKLICLLADRPEENPAAWRRNGAPSAGQRSWARAALEQEAEAVACSLEGKRNNSLNHAAFRVGQLTGAELIEEGQAVDTLLSAAETSGLPRGEAQTTIDSGLEAGMKKPRAPTSTPSTHPPGQGGRRGRGTREKQNSEAQEAATERISELAERTSRRLIALVDEGGRNRDPKGVVDDAAIALQEKSDGRLYARGGSLVRVETDEEERPVVQRLGERELHGELLRAVIFLGRNRRGDPEPKEPPGGTIKFLLGASGLPFRPLRGITEAPLLRPDGTILSEPGYDSATGLLYKPAACLHALNMSAHPTRQEIQRAKALILEVFSQFPFVDEASQANAVALLLTGFVQPLVNDHRPICAVTARQAGSGKGLLVSAVSHILTGKPPTITRFRREEELEKKIAQLLNKGAQVISIDNVKVRLESATFESVLTSRRFSDRVLGHNTLGMDVPQDAVWTATGNNLELGTEMARRAYFIELDPKHPKPEERTGPRKGESFKRLDRWVLERRGELIGAVLTTCRGWWVAGRPKAKMRAMGSFEEWQEIVGGILEFLEIPGFLDNRDQMRLFQDQERAQIEVFLRAIREGFGTAGFTARELKSLVLENPDMHESLPEECADSLKRDDGSQRLGNYLRKIKGRRVTADGLRIELAGANSHDKVAEWKVVSDDHFGVKPPQFAGNVAGH